MPLIDDPLSRRVADLFNVVNEVMLLALTRFFAHTDETPEQLATLESLGVGLMFAAIKPLGQILTALPFGPSAPGRTAGPTFEVFYIGGYLLPHRARPREAHRGRRRRPQGHRRGSREVRVEAGGAIA